MFDKIIREAQDAAASAALNWMNEAVSAGPKFEVFETDVFGNDRGGQRYQMLDICGNAHVRAKDGRTAFAKYLKKTDPQGNRYTITVPLNYSLRGRQEYGLHCAAARAALEVLNKYPETNGTCRIWEYID